MEGKAARIARHAVLAVFLCLGFAGLVGLALLWRGQPPSTGLVLLQLLFGLGVVLAVLWIWAAWAALRQCRPAGCWVGVPLLAGFTALDTGLLDVSDGPLHAGTLAMHVLLWGAVLLGGALALRRRAGAA